MKLSMMTVRIMILNIMALGITTRDIMSFSTMTVSKTTFSTITLSIITHHSSKMYLPIVLPIMSYVIMLNVIMFTVVAPNFIRNNSSQSLC